jgi:Fur family transcriptional regulator, ferric uptake regulator
VIAMQEPASGRATAQARNHLTDALGRAGERLTEPRRVVAGLIVGREGHFTAAELVDEARQVNPGIGRATVFRAIDLFSSLGLLERVDLPAGDHAYVACDSVHHHHAICTKCGRAQDVADAGLGDVLAEIGAHSGFTVTAHRLEIFGICGVCAAEKGAA